MTYLFTEDTTTPLETVTGETLGADTPVKNEVVSDEVILTVGAVDGETVLLSAEAQPEPVATTEATLGFQPVNFVNNLSYMGIGMLTIFLVIGVIILFTLAINKIFSRKK